MSLTTRPERIVESSWSICAAEAFGKVGERACTIVFVAATNFAVSILTLALRLAVTDVAISVFAIRSFAVAGASLALIPIVGRLPLQVVTAGPLRQFTIGFTATVGIALSLSCSA